MGRQRDGAVVAGGMGRAEIRLTARQSRLLLPTTSQRRVRRRNGRNASRRSCGNTDARSRRRPRQPSEAHSRPLPPTLPRPFPPPPPATATTEGDPQPARQDPTLAATLAPALATTRVTVPVLATIRRRGGGREGARVRRKDSGTDCIPISRPWHRRMDGWTRGHGLGLGLGLHLGLHLARREEGGERQRIWSRMFWEWHRRFCRGQIKETCWTR